MGINQVQLGVSGHIVVSFTCVFSRSFPSAQDASRYTQGKHAGERGDNEMCFNSNETFFSPRRPTFKCAGDGGRVFNRRRVQLRVFSAAALAHVTHVSLSGSSEIPPHSSEQK